ncbi:MAG: RecBCD enzyme subunit RecD [Thermoanaerobaculia bacterium]|nr:RecBCD enzyme subunit RecD [Thermoanaerobaculia bacterium]
MSRPVVPLTPRGTLAEKRGRPMADLPFAQELIGRAIENDIPESALYLSWELSRMAEDLPRAEKEALSVLILVSFLEVRRGSTALPLDSGPKTALSSLLYRLKVEPEMRARVEALAEKLRVGAGEEFARPLVGQPGTLAPLVVENGLLYHHRLWSAERRVGESATGRAGKGPWKTEEVEAALAEVLDAPPLGVSGEPARLSEGQVAALRRALGARLALISGGPGTGKTFIVLSLLRVLARLGIPPAAIAVAAPTGKAANRLETSMRGVLAVLPGDFAADQRLREELPAPVTLHRLLAFSPSAGRFFHHEKNRLRQKVVIVDEASMVGLELMDQLLRSLSQECPLILLGDADQLPSVDSGAVFRDLTARSRGAIRLSKSFRVSPESVRLLETAEAVRVGAAQALLEGRRERGPLISREDRSACVSLHAAGEDGALEKRLTDWYQGMFASDPEAARALGTVYRGTGEFTEAEARSIAALFRHFERSRLLCVTRGPGLRTGTSAVNGYLHGKRFEALSQRGTSWRSMPDFLPGEPVLMERNDYGLALFNGDQGLVLRIGDEAGETRLMAVFLRDGEKPEAFPIDLLRADLTLAYALTVHKSQGSEFDETVLILPDEPIPLLTRELVYTALTRSRKRTEFWGSADVLRRGVEQATRRFTNLAPDTGQSS